MQLYSTNITELEKSPLAVLRQAQGKTLAILKDKRPTAYLVPAAVYEQLLEQLEDYELGQLLKERQIEKPLAIEVTLDEL